MANSQNIELRDAGVWVTCVRGKEAKCISEVRDLFEEYVKKLYPEAGLDVADSLAQDVGIEDEITKELEGLQKPTKAPLFAPVKVDMDCVVFFKTRPPIDPVSLAHEICADAAKDRSLKRTRFVKRLSPVSLTTRATESDVDELSKEVLAPHFHQENGARKFAIRPTIRNSNMLSRDGVIKQVASAVGPGHSVDLRGYDMLIIVEVYKGICGMSVVGSDYDQLKRYNLAELYDPTRKPGESAENSKATADESHD
ncbi:MAG: hypothetical protein M1821_004577 [Bathelium mastoideum]|nr:MAG: hypothetical protein M1821_004577 [Bathelium mastoideum]